MKRKLRRDPVVLSQMRPLTLFLVLCGCIAFTFALIHADSVLHFVHAVISALGPVIAGFVIAYLLNPAMTWMEHRIFPLLQTLLRRHPNQAKTAARGISSFLAVLLFLGTAVALLAVMFSQLVDSISTLIGQLPSYLQNLSARIEELLQQDNHIREYLTEMINRFFSSEMVSSPTEIAQKLVSALASGAAGTLSLIYDVVIGFIVAVYMLISKERFVRQWKRLLFALLKPKTARWVNERVRIANKTFGTAIVGKLADSVIIGMLCFLGTVLLKIPYSALISVIIGVTNVIPFFGPIIGAIPCVLLVLLESPMKALYFLIFIVALQQFDCNILDPKIVGSSIGLPAFWELFACLLGGGLFGIIGMVLGVPLFAVIYTIIKELVSEVLQDKEIPEEILRGELGIEPHAAESGLFDADDGDPVDSEYVQHLILLEEISEGNAHREP